jgi:hypothetical protein
VRRSTALVVTAALLLTAAMLVASPLVAAAADDSVVFLPEQGVPDGAHFAAETFLCTSKPFTISTPPGSCSFLQFGEPAGLVCDVPIEIMDNLDGVFLRAFECHDVLSQTPTTPNAA